MKQLVQLQEMQADHVGVREEACADEICINSSDLQQACA